MPRGGARPGAGRKVDPNSARQKARAAKAAEKSPAGFTSGDGKRTASAPPAWPFGTAPSAAPAVAPAPTEPVATPVAPPAAEPAPENALAYLQWVYRNHEDERMRMQAAATALPFETSKPLPVKGKGDTRGGPATKVSKFASMAPPKLAAVNGAKV
jgi:hypothetical protein